MFYLLTCLSWDRLIFIPASFSPFNLNLPSWLWVLPASLISVGFYLLWRKTRSDGNIEPVSSVPRADTKSVIEFSRYAGGHPEIDIDILPCVVFIEQEYIHLCRYQDSERKQLGSLGKIPMNEIREFRVEDVFTMKRKLSPENWDLTIKHLLDLNQRKGSEVAFVVIEWIFEGKTANTYLCIEGEYAMEWALGKRNLLVKAGRKEVLQFA